MGSQDREIKKKEAPPSWLNETPPTFERGMRPEAIQKEEEKPIIEPKKTFAPKKNPKLVEKFLASAGPDAEQKVVKQETKQEVVSETQTVVNSDISETQKLVQSLDGLFPQQPPENGGYTQQVSSTSSAFSEALHQSFSSVSFEKQELASQQEFVASVSVTSSAKPPPHTPTPC